MSTLKEKSIASEVKESPSSEQEVFDSIVKPEFKLQHFRRVSEYYAEKADFTWIIRDIKNFLKKSRGTELESEVFPLTGYPFGARAKVKIGYAFAEFFLSFKHLNQSIPEEEIRVKPIPNFYFTVKDQSEGKDRKDLIRTNYSYFKHKFEFNNFNLSKCILVNFSLVNFPLYTVDDQWAIAIHVEAPEVSQSVYSEDGILTWAIDDFRKRKQAEVDGLIEYHVSPYFNTGPKGYRVQVRACLNGMRKYRNKGLSIFVVFLDGVNDKDLDDSFDHEITVTIVHPTRSISRNLTLNYRSDEWIDMVSCAEIEGLLHNDTLYYKVEIIERK